VLLLPFAALAAYSPTQPRFSASYMRKMSLSLNGAMTSAEWDVLGELSHIRENLNSAASTSDYVEYAMGTADIDTLDNIFRFNITYLNFTTNGKGVQNSKPRATTLLMYDVVLGAYNSSQLYRAGTNFTWATQSCACNQITLTSGGGSAPMLYLPPNAVNQGQVTITVNKKTIASTLWTFETIGFIPSENDHAPVALPINYQFYVSSNSNFLDRVSYTFSFASGSTSTVEFDFWSHSVMISSFMIVPDSSCAKSCYSSVELSIRAQPVSFYPSTCEHIPNTGCVCQNMTLNSRPFCQVPWSISADIDFETNDKYAMHIKNLTVDSQLNTIPTTCAAELSDFICRFYFPPCDPFGARIRPPINGTLKCWEGNPKYYNNQGTVTPQNPNDALELARIWEEYELQSRLENQNQQTIDNQDKREVQGPIANSPSHIAEPVAPADPPSASNPSHEQPPTHSAPSSTSEPQIVESPRAVVEPPTAISPSHPTTPSSTGPTPSHPAPSASEPQEMTPEFIPAPIQPPSAPVFMSNDSIAYVTSFSTFSSYDVVAKVSVTYPDIYTLKNWQIALMLFGSIGLLLTIIISIIMANRKVVNHFEKV
jgi:hypothetical protein